MLGQSGDETFVSSTSSELKRYGYEGGTCNIPAAYLTGLLFGKRAKEVGFDDAILDTGLHTPIHCSNVYAALKGAVNSGMNISHNPSVFPPDERIRGEHIAKNVQKPSLLDNFEAVKKEIMTESREDREMEKDETR